MAKKRRGRKRIYKNAKERMKAYEKKSWYKAMKVSYRLAAAEKQLVKYTALVKKLRVEVKKYK